MPAVVTYSPFEVWDENALSARRATAIGAVYGTVVWERLVLAGTLIPAPEPTQ